MSKNKNFESSLIKIEEIVDQLEESEVSLEKALKLFEEGVKEVQFCHTELRSAEQKVEKLIEENGSLKTVPFESDQN